MQCKYVPRANNVHHFEKSFQRFYTCKHNTYAPKRYVTKKIN